MYYVDWFLRWNTAPDIITKCHKTLDTKELTECMAAYVKLHKALCKQFKDKAVLFDIGSGATPRFSILAAHMTTWDCIAIDPQLNMSRQYNTDRLTLINKKAEDTDLPSMINEDHKFAVFTFIHSHAPVRVIKQLINRLPLFIFCMPCCVPQDDIGLTWEFYRDNYVTSPKNLCYWTTTTPQS